MSKPPSPERFVSLLIAVLFFGSVAVGTPAQAGQWEWQNPLPQGNHLHDVCFINSTAGFAVGDGQTILQTADGGVNWHLLHTGTTGRDFVKLQMLDANAGWVLDRQSYPSEHYWVQKTPDGWSTWTPVYESAEAVYDIYWLDYSEGWVATEQGLRFTNNGGLTWDLILSAVPVQSVFFLNSSEGWCGSNSFVYRTSDGGQTWDSVAVLGKIVKIQFQTAQDGWLIEWEERGFNYEAGRVFASHDSGASWTEQLFIGGDFGPYDHFVDMEMLDTQTGFVCSEYGYLSQTSDAGTTWTEIDSLYGAQALEFVDQTTGWSVGWYGRIGHTEDGGLNWSGQLDGHPIRSSEWSDVQFLDTQIGFASGDKSLLRTIDGGANWQQIPIDMPPTEYGGIAAMYFLDDQHGWIAWDKTGGWGAILYTDDGGQTTTVQEDDIYRCFDISFLDDNVGWAVGHRLYHTVDGGENWVEQTPPVEDQFVSVCFVDSLEGWLGGYVGSVLHTTDGGQSWSEQDIGQLTYIRSLSFRDDQQGFAFGYFWPDGLVFRTADGGENWERVLTVPNATLFDGVTIFDSYVYVVGEGLYSPREFSHFYKSTDAGYTWERQTDMLLADGIFKIAAFDPWHIWLLGDGGSISYGPLGTGTGISAAPAAQTQLFQNYPNPFNPQTTIAYHLRTASDVELTIYNVLGERVVRWVQPSQTVGRHHFTWDGRDTTGRPVASGLYFCRLKAGEVIQTRKMLLLK